MTVTPWRGMVPYSEKSQRIKDSSETADAGMGSKSQKLIVFVTICLYFWRPLSKDCLKRFPLLNVDCFSHFAILTLRSRKLCALLAAQKIEESVCSAWLNTSSKKKKERKMEGMQATCKISTALRKKVSCDKTGSWENSDKAMSAYGGMWG